MPVERHKIMLSADVSKQILELWSAKDNFCGSMLGQPLYVGGGKYELKIVILNPEQTKQMQDFVKELIVDDPDSPKRQDNQREPAKGRVI